MTKCKMLTEELFEDSTYFAGFKDKVDDNFDDDNLTIKNVSLTYFKSNHDRIYEASAMKDLRVLSDKAPVFLGHALKDKHATGDQIGHIENPRGDKTRNRGELVFYEEHPEAALHYRLAKEDSTSFALSHEVIKHESKRTGRTRHVNRVNENQGYAIVRKGGTNQGIFESDEKSMADIKTVKDLHDEYPLIAAALFEEGKTEGAAKASKQLNEEVATITLERDKNVTKIEEMEGQLNEAAAEKKHEEVKIELREKAKKLCEKHERKWDPSDALLESFAKMESAEEGSSSPLMESYFDVEPKDSDEDKKKAKSSSGTSKSKRRRRQYR